MLSMKGGYLFISILSLLRKNVPWILSKTQEEKGLCQLPHNSSRAYHQYVPVKKSLLKEVINSKEEKLHVLPALHYGEFRSMWYCGSSWR